MARQFLYQATSLYDGDEPANVEPGGGRFWDTFELPLEWKDFAPWEPAGEFDLHSGAIAVADGQSWFDCGEMPFRHGRREVWSVPGCVQHEWTSTGARYGELRTNLTRLGNLELRPSRHGYVRVAPSQ